MKTTKIMITSASFAIAMSALAHAGMNSTLIDEPSATSNIHGVEDAATVGARSRSKSPGKPVVTAETTENDRKVADRD